MQKLKKTVLENLMNGYVLEYKTYLDVYNEYHKNRLNNNNIINKIDHSQNKDEIFELALNLISFFISDNYFAERNIAKFK